MMVKIMRPLFKLPGRSAVDALTSWVGDGTIGVLLTSRQYEEGYYTKKEAAIIGSTFSVVSITFCIVVLDQVGLGNYFHSLLFNCFTLWCCSCIYHAKNLSTCRKRGYTY